MKQLSVKFACNVSYVLHFKLQVFNCNSTQLHYVLIFYFEANFVSILDLLELSLKEFGS